MDRWIERSQNNGPHKNSQDFTKAKSRGKSPRRANVRVFENWMEQEYQGQLWSKARSFNWDNTRKMENRAQVQEMTLARRTL